MTTPNEPRDAPQDDNPLGLAGLTELAELLGVSRQRVHQIVSNDKTFPRRTAHLSAGMIWLRAEVKKWANENGRPVTE